MLKNDDFFIRENSIKAFYKLQIIFKTRILKLLSRFYLQEENKVPLRQQLENYRMLLNRFIEESSVRLETDDFRKIIILKEAKQEEHRHYDYRLT